MNKNIPIINDYTVPVYIAILAITFKFVAFANCISCQANLAIQLGLAMGVDIKLQVINKAPQVHQSGAAWQFG
jgi:hypothetical protein